MIKINKAYYSSDSNYLMVDILNTDMSINSYESISSIYASKFINGIEYKYDITTNKDYINSVYAPKINLGAGYTIVDSTNEFIIFNLSSANDSRVTINTSSLSSSKSYIFKIVSSSVLYDNCILDIDTETIMKDMHAGNTYALTYSIEDDSWGFSIIDDIINLSDTLETTLTLSVNISSDLVKQNIDNPDFNTYGIAKVSLVYIDGQSHSYTYSIDEFYSHKVKMLNIDSSMNNYEKLSKKLNTYIFLEQMFINALSNEYINDANSYYSEMVKLSQFGYSDMIQNNPNANY